MENNEGLFLYCKTYNTSYDGIFRFDPVKIEYKLLFIKDDCFLFKTPNNDIVMYKKHDKCNTGESIIFQVIINDKNIYHLKNPIFSIPKEPKKNIINIIKNKIWYRVNSLKNDKNNNKNEIEEEENEDYYLSKNDVIKFGTEIYILREIHFNNNNDGDISPNYNSFNNNKRDVFILCTEPKILDNKSKYYVSIQKDPNMII